ncbi:MAG: dTMP kinase [Bacillota bacterium]|nr:dTMP kinase [Bacillota bacterium]
MFKTHGLFITLEGIDGCGKSTQSQILQDNLKRQGAPFVAVREPGGTPAGEDIRRILLQKSYPLTLSSELLLYMAARVELTERVIAPALLEGKLVLGDRFADSTLAYQGYGGGVDLNWIRMLNDRATGGLKPHLTILLDLSVEAAAVRRGRAADRMESNDLHYHQRVRRGYLEIARLDPQRVAVIDASTDAEAQGKQIWRLVEKLMFRQDEKGWPHEL